MDYSPPGSSVHGIPQARILEWVAIPLSKSLPDPGIELESLTSPALAGKFFVTRHLGNLSKPLENINWELATHWVPYKIPKDKDKKTCPMSSVRGHFLILYRI